MSDTPTPQPPPAEKEATMPTTTSTMLAQMLSANPLVAILVVLLGAGGVNVTSSASQIAAAQQEIRADVEAFGGKVDDLFQQVQGLREDRWTRTDMERWQRNDHAPLRQRVEQLERDLVLLKDRADR